MHSTPTHHELSTTRQNGFLDLASIKKPWVYINLLAAPCLAASLFLPWFTTTGLGRIGGRSGALSAWHSLGTLNYYLAFCANGAVTIAPWIAARGDRVSWAPGELSSMLGVIGIGLILFRGFVLRPGAPSGEIHVGLGYLIGIGAMLVLTYSAILRMDAHPKVRRPPGLL